MYNLYRFAVSLLCGPQPDRASVAFTFSPRFDLGWAIRNAKINREWGEEEGESLSKFPFCSEQPFTLEIFASPDAYLVMCLSCRLLLLRLSFSWCVNRWLVCLVLILIGFVLYFFQVAIDGHHYCEFRHRTQYSEADTLQIIGDVRITLVEFKHSHIYPQAPPVNRLNVSQPVIKIKKTNKLAVIIKLQSKLLKF